MPGETCTYDDNREWTACTTLCQNDSECPDLPGESVECADWDEYSACTINCGLLDSCPEGMSCEGFIFNDFCAWP